MTLDNQKQAEEVPPELWLTPSVLTRIQETIGARKAESGGMLGGNRETGQVTAFHFDEQALEQSAGAYSPNHTLLTRVLKQEWKPKGIQFLGFVHSHPPHYTHPSPWDKEYAGRLIAKMELPYMLLPIIRTAADTGTFTLFPYVAKRGDNEVEIIKQGLRVGEKAGSSAKSVQDGKSSNVHALEIVAELGLAAVNLTAAGVALVQAVGTLRQRQQHGKEIENHDQ